MKPGCHLCNNPTRIDGMGVKIQLFAPILNRFVPMFDDMNARCSKLVYAGVTVLGTKPLLVHSRAFTFEMSERSFNLI